MSKRARYPQSRRHVFIYDKDWEFLEAHYGLQSDSKMGTGATVREIIHNYVERLKARTQQSLDQAQFRDEHDQDQASLRDEHDEELQ